MNISMLGFEFTAEMLGWIVTGVIGLFAVFGMFWGLVRGLQKTAFRGLWLILVALLLLLLTPIITKWLMAIDLSGFGWEISGQPVTSVDGVISTLLSNIEGIGEATADNPILTEFISKLPFLLLNSVVFVLLFWIFKILLWPLWAIFAKAFFKKYKTIDGVKGKKMPKTEREKVRNFKGLGMLLGIMCGLFVGALTVMPVMGVLDVVTKLNGANVSFMTGEPTEEGVVDYYAGEYSDMLEGATDNLGTKILNYTGLGWVSDQMFDQLSTIKVGDDSISLNDEVDGVVGVLNAVGEIRCTDFDNLTQDSVSNVIVNARKIVNYVFELKTFTVVGDELVPYLVDVLSEQDFVNTGVEQGDTVIDEALLELAQTNMDYLKNEFLAIINIAEVANDADVLVPLIYKSIPFDEYLERCDDQFVDDIVDALFSSRIFSAISVTALNEGLQYAMEEFEIGDYEENTDLTVDTIKAQFKNIFKNGIELAKHMDIDGDSYNIEKEALSPIGGILDSLKTLMTSNTFNEIVDMAKGKLEESIESGEDNFYMDNILDAIENFKIITNYEEEFEIYEDVWDDIMALKDADFSNTENMDFSLLGRVLDGLRDSRVFGPVINDTMVDLLTQVQESITSDESEDLEMTQAIDDAFTIIIWNIEDESLERSDTFWADELTAFGSLFDMDMSNVGSDTGTSIRDIGAILDDIRVSVLLTREMDDSTSPLDGKSAFELLVDVMFDKATESTGDGNALLTDVLVEMKENLLGLPSTVTYEVEFGYLADFMDEMEDFDASGLTPGSTEFETTITDFGSMLDGLADSKLFVNANNESCPDIRQKFVTYMLDELQSSMSEGFTQTLLESMKDNVKYITSYEAEFGYISSLTSMVDTFDGSSGSTGFDESMANLGETLDDLGGSKLFVHEDDPTDLTDATVDLRRDILTYLVEQIKVNLNSALGTGVDASALVGEENSLTAEMLINVNNMPLPSQITDANDTEDLYSATPYADEMTHLLKLIDALSGITSYGTLLNSSSPMFSLGQNLDELKQGYTEGLKTYKKSILCENSGYYVVKMFVNAISGVSNLTSAITDATVRTNITNAFATNIEKVNATNYYADGIAYTGTVATGLNYTQALVSFMQTMNLFTQLSTFTGGSSSGLNPNTANSVADILNNLQNQPMADYDLAKIIGAYALTQFRNGLDSETYSLWVAAVDREIGYINAVTSDYVGTSTGNGYQASLYIAVSDTTNVMGDATARNSVLSTYSSSTYSITFTADSEVEYYGVLPVMVSRENGSITLPACTVVRDGYTFAGWSDGTTTYAAGSSYALTGNITFTASWVCIIEFAVDSGVTYSGTLPAAMEQGSGTTITLPDCTIVRDGYTFAGWSSVSGTTSVEYAVGSTYTMPASNITLYAVWTLNV